MTESTSRETLESANENNKAKRGLSSSTFLQQFVKDYVEKRPSAVKNELIEEVMKAETLSGTKASQGLMEFRASDEKYSDINLAEIDVFMLRKQLAKGFLQLAKARQDLETQVLKNYDITPDIYETKVSSVIKTLSLGDIQKYRNSEYQLEVFLKKYLGKTVSSRVKFDMLAGISEAQMQQRVRAMKEPQKTEIALILKKLQNAGVPRDDEIRALVESSLFDEVQKVTFVQTFMPFISLQKAVDIGLLEAKKAEKIQDTYISDILKNSDISADNKKEIEKTLSFSDIQVATRELVKSTPDVLKVSEAMGFQEFVSDTESQNIQAREKARSLGPKNFEGLKVSLADFGASRCSNVGLLKPGNIVKFTKQKSGSDENIDYIKIVDFDDEKAEFRYQNIGNETINLKSIGEPKTVRYEDFYTNLKADTGTRFEVFASEMIHAKIKSGDIQSSELQTLEAADFQGDDQKNRRDEVKQKQQEILEKELRDLESEFAGKTDEEKKDANILAKIASKKKELEKFRTSELSFTEIAEYSNKQEFLGKIDEVDPEGKSLGFSSQVSFYTGKGDDTQVYILDSIDMEAGEIHFHNRSHIEKLSFDTFFQTFKKKDAKRIKRVSSETELVSSFGDNFEYKDGGIIQKKAEHNGKTENREVEYMANEKNKLLKIHSISGGFVEFYEGEIDDGKHDDGHGKHDAHGKGHGHHASNDKKYTLKIEGAHLEKWTLDEFQKYVKDEKLVPDWKLGQSYQVIPQEHQNKMHGSFIDKFMKGTSISEIIHGGTMVVEGITESLHHGSEGKAAHAALKMAEWLPGELKEDIRMKVEAAEGEEMTHALEALGKVDSWIAVERIEKWLKNKDTPEYKIEAGLLFMIEKYGHLTAKNASKDGKKGLYQYRGKFIWYERLGGHINDELYNEVKAEAEQDGQTFSEEKLVHKLLKKQCDSRAHHYSGKHRRSRIHKEYENKWKSGISGELEKGEKDADAFRNSKTMIREGIGEATGGTTSNAFGWAKRVVSRGTGTLEDMMHVPSVLLLSGACFDIDQATYAQVKKLWDEGMPVIAFRMFGDKAKMENFNETVLELSKEIQKAGYPDAKYSKIQSRAQEIFDASRSRSGKEKERIEAASKFWEDYGEVLSRGLNFSLQGDNKFAATDTIIKRKKDENSIFKKYYATARGAAGEPGAFKDDYVDDWAGATGIFGLNPHDIILQHVTFDQGGGFRNKSIGPKVWQHFVDDINATRNKILVPGERDVNSSINKKAQEEYIAELLEEITGSFYEMAGLRTDYIYGLNKETSNIGREFNKWGLNLEQSLGAISSVDILNGSKRGVFEKVARNIIAGNMGTGSDRSPDVLMNQVKKQTAANLNRGGNEYE